MRENLGVELALDALLVTSFTCVGLLALWATTSPRHWFVRFAVFFGLISPLLFVPAYEPFIAFCVQFLVVLAVVPFARLLRASRDQSPDQTWFQTVSHSQLPAFRISMASVLLLTVPIATGVLIAARLPALNLDAWNSVVLTGITAGLATLIAAWMFVAKRKTIVWPVAIFCTLLIAALPAWIDWIVPSITNAFGWPPSPNSGLIAAIPLERPVRDWFYVIPIFGVTLTILLFAWRSAFHNTVTGRAATSRQHADRRLKQLGFAVLVLIVAAFPLAIVMRLMTPLPIPRVAMPEPNGYDDFVAAGKMINSPILGMVREPKSTDELGTEIDKSAEVFARIRLGLSRPCLAPALQPQDDAGELISMSLADIQAIRADARAMSRDAELAQQQGRYGDAAKSSLDCIRVSQALSRGSLLVHYFVSMAIEGIGQSNLYPTIDHLDAPTCRELIADLREIETNREPIDAIWHRERIYSENAYGWYGLLVTLLEDVSHSYGQTFNLIYPPLYQKQVVARMLILALAIRCHVLEHGTPPDSLAELVPEILDEIPIDPFDPNGQPLKFLKTDEGFVLYSVGPNQVDDGGTVSTNEENPLQPQSGDLSLAAYFAAEQAIIHPLAVETSDDGADNSDADVTIPDAL